MHKTTVAPAARHAHVGSRPTMSMVVEATRHKQSGNAPDRMSLHSSAGDPTNVTPMPPASSSGFDYHQISQADPQSTQPITDIQHLTAWVDAWQNGEPGERSQMSQPEVHAKWLQDYGQPDSAFTPMLWATAHINNLAQQVAAHASGAAVAAHAQASRDTPSAATSTGPSGTRNRPCMEKIKVVTGARAMLMDTMGGLPDPQVTQFCAVGVYASQTGK